jgi:catechol 2,3-dioxygenase-like lactoylglutathione lyase family enzyme
MLGYMTMGTNDITRAGAFYDKLASELGVSRMMQSDRFIAWGAPGKAGFGVAKPYDGKPACVGNGCMAAFMAKDKAQVDRLYAIALANGGADEGPPGPRFDGFYAAYFRDPDGNKCNAFVMGGG